jgi:peroxiredoxin
MGAWEKNQNIDCSDLINFLADPLAEVTKSLGTVLGTHAEGIYIWKLGYKKCKRMVCIVVDEVIKALNVSEAPGDPAGDDHPEMTCAPQMLKESEALSK